MSLSICTDCLSRLRVPSVSRTWTIAACSATQASLFHTSAAQYASPLKKKTVLRAPPKLRAANSVKMKKKGRERPKLPPVGERKNQRRRIVLSNTNALEVDGLEIWSPENMVDSSLTGRVMALDGQLLDQLRDSKAFKKSQNWNMFRRPTTLIRSETAKIGQEVQAVTAAQEPKIYRHLVTGNRASGKSVFNLQTMCMAYMNGWIVINVPEAKDLVNNTSSYAPMKQADDRSERLYIHPHQTQALLARILYSNESVLKGFGLNHPLPESLSLRKNPTLKDLVQIGEQDHTLAWAAWQAFWRELSQPGKDSRPPVLVAVDGIDQWMGLTRYRNTEFKFLHAHEFALIRQFNNLLFSTTTQKAPLVNGGMILFSTSGSNTPAFPTFNLLINQMRARSQGIPATAADFPLPAPFSKPDQRVLDLVPGSQNVELVDLKGLGALESKGLLEHYARSGLLQTKITDVTVAEFRGLSAGGLVGELARLGNRVRS